MKKQIIGYENQCIRIEEEIIIRENAKKIKKIIREIKNNNGLVKSANKTFKVEELQEMKYEMDKKQ